MDPRRCPVEGYEGWVGLPDGAGTTGEAIVVTATHHTRSAGTGIQTEQLVEKRTYVPRIQAPKDATPGSVYRYTDTAGHPCRALRVREDTWSVYTHVVTETVRVLNMNDKALAHDCGPDGFYKELGGF